VKSVVGLDLSLTGTGVGIVDRSGDVRLFTVSSKGKKDDDLLTRSVRLERLATGILQYVAAADPELAVIEGPSMASKFGHPHDRSGLWWLVVHTLHTRGLTVVEVPPSNRMMYATGKGNAAKDAVLTAVVRRYQHLVAEPIEDNNTADALVLAAMGRRHLGCEIDPTLPATHLKAMDKVHW
jgi:crossover junction endodeoxyribonuclease RuvC